MAQTGFLVAGAGEVVLDLRHFLDGHEQVEKHVFAVAGHEVAVGHGRERVLRCHATAMYGSSWPCIIIVQRCSSGVVTSALRPTDRSQFSIRAIVAGSPSLWMKFSNCSIAYILD